MSFTYPQAESVLLQSIRSGRMPHALLFTGTPAAGTHKLALRLARELNGAEAESVEALRHTMCRVLRPSSKTRRILIEDVRGIEPFLALKAEPGQTKLVVILEADRMMEEAANAFLKTLEEPPPQTLIILVTEQPSRLLVTILSRCVRLNLREAGAQLHLSEVQQLFLPAVAAALRNVGGPNSDVAALALRADFVSLLAERKEVISDHLNAALKAEAKEIAAGTDIKDWEARQKDATAALIETEYLAEREQMLELLSLCFGQAVLVASHAPDVQPVTPEVAQLAAALPVEDLLRRMRVLEALRTDLNFNVFDQLALDARLVDIIGTTPL